MPAIFQEEAAFFNVTIVILNVARMKTRRKLVVSCDPTQSQLEVKCDDFHHCFRGSRSSVSSHTDVGAQDSTGIAGHGRNELQQLKGIERRGAQWGQPGQPHVLRRQRGADVEKQPAFLGGRQVTRQRIRRRR